MSRDQEPFEEDGKAEAVTGELSSDDEIIELVDVVRKGDLDQDSGADDLALLLDEEGDPETEALFDEKVEEEAAGFSDTYEEAPLEDLETDLEHPHETPEETFDSPDFDFETEELEEPDADALSKIPQEDLENVMAGLTDEIETPETDSVAVSEELPPISTERLEEIITESVRDVVEKVTRETMAEVAEKVIKEAIEGLKQSLEPTPE